MSLKSLWSASLGRLKQGVSKTLSTASLGLLRKRDEEPPEERFVQPGSFTTGSGIPLYDLQRVKNNNLILILATDSVLY